ncbi:MAG: hypothetical protein A2Z52_02795 [Candidatus Moranbacteria bacterium RBG_19FT_COMBO_42_6]|nr:MAG: hypothetical protein A2Z52_02795 [Candidatus Moranbacteria bacterium RBG_19FT_COMBO_42_6]
MERMKNKTSFRFGRIFAASIILVLAVFVLQNVRKAESSDCDLLTGDDKKKCEELEKKAEAYQDLIDIKNKQQATLQRQMDLIDLEQSKNQQDLKIIHSKAESLSEQIKDLEIQILAKENLISYQKSILGGLMQSYYEDYQEGVLNIVLIDKNFSDVLSQSDYLGQASARLKDILVTIGIAKDELESEQNSLAEAKRKSEELKDQLEDKKYNLQSNENQKQSLLSKTQGEEAKYQQLLARVEQQKLELFNFGASGNAGDVLASVSKYPKPDSKYWASTSWFFSQRDPRWANIKIGNSSSLMKDYGCAVSAVSMVFKYYGASIDPGKMAKQPIFYYELIKWPTSWSPNIDLASSTAHSGVNWSAVDKYIKNKQPVIIYIKKASGGGGHYVVIHGKDSKDYIVHDPYFGANLYLKTSMALMGEMNPKSGTINDQIIVYN